MMDRNFHGGGENDFPKIPQPALRALNGAGYFRLEQLTQIRKSDLSKLHGMGPKALGILGQALTGKGLTFKKEL